MKTSTKIIQALLVALGLVAIAPLGYSQSVGLPTPRLLTVVPMGGKVGSEFEVTVTGDYIDDAEKLIFSDNRITAKK